MLTKILPVMLALLFAAGAHASVTTSSFVAAGAVVNADPIDARALFSFNNVTITSMAGTLIDLVSRPSRMIQGGQYDVQVPDGSVDCAATDGSVECPAGATPAPIVPTSMDARLANRNTGARPTWPTYLNLRFPVVPVVSPTGTGTDGQTTGDIMQIVTVYPFVNGTGTGTLTLGGGKLPLLCLSNDCSNGNATSVPEPVASALTGTGLIGMYFIRRRRRVSR
jgi:hypothetical protein